MKKPNHTKKNDNKVKLIYNLYIFERINYIIFKLKLKKNAKVKDPNAPKRPKTAYFIWLTENRTRLTKKGRKLNYRVELCVLRNEAINCIKKSGRGMEQFV